MTGRAPLGGWQPPGGFDVSERFFEPGVEAVGEATRSSSARGNAEPARLIGGAELLAAVREFVRRYVVLTDEQADAITLWVAHTHALDAAEATPYLNVSSAEKESGKTRLLETLETVVARPWLTGRVTAAVLARKTDADRPTLLLDESDAAFTGEKEYAEALRGLLNSGYRRSGRASVCVGQGANLRAQDFSTFGAKAIAGIGDRLPDTVASRSVPVRLKRRAPGEQVERFRERKVRAEAAPLRERLEAFAAVNVERLRELEPVEPDGLSDRATDVWEPLLAIADLAGSDWPERARRAAVALSGAAARHGADSPRVRLLASIRTVHVRLGGEHVFTRDLIRELAADEEGAWAEWWDAEQEAPAKGCARRLGSMLAQLDVPRSRTVGGAGSASAKGYRWEWFEDAFSRYLPPQSVESVETAQPSQKQGGQNPSKASPLDGFPNVANPHGYSGSTDSTDLTPGEGAGEASEPPCTTLEPDLGEADEWAERIRGNSR